MENFALEEKEFIDYCKKKKNSERTIYGRIEALKHFYKNYETLNTNTYTDFYEDICDRLKPNSINNRINSINAYIYYLQDKYNIDLSNWQKANVRTQKVQFLDDIISMEDYEFLITKLKAREKDKLFILCKIMATTGMKIHETLSIKRLHIENGVIDFYGKGNKERRCYFTEQVKQEVIKILDKHNIGKDDYIISSHWSGKKIGWENLGVINKSLRNFAENECEFKKGLIHPHMFRHFFAKNFIKKYQNIALLADLLGHSSIDTTRIYLKYTSKEQAEIVNQVVNW